MKVRDFKCDPWALIVGLFVVLFLTGRADALDPTESFRQGTIYLEQGRVELAIWAFSNAIEENASYVDAYNNRALAYYRQGNKDQARDDLLKAVELDPDNQIANSNLGILFFEQGDYKEALVYLERAIGGHVGCSPWDNIIYTNLAYIYSRLGMEGMVKELKKTRALRCPESENGVMPGAREEFWFKRNFIKRDDHMLKLVIRKGTWQ